MANLSRQAREHEKQTILFTAYKAMGMGRSLQKLHELVVAAGGRIGSTTIDRYSVKYQWQKRLLEAAAKDQERLERDFGDSRTR